MKSSKLPRSAGLPALLTTRTRKRQDPDSRPYRHIKDADGMVLRDNVFGTPEEDALSRDFTINALFYNIADFSVIDYSTGLSDLTQRLIRPIGDPYVRFTEDPVRMLRAVRFAASHDFVESAAWEVLCELSSTIHASPHQGSMKRYRRYSSSDLPGRFLAFWTRAGSLPPFSPTFINGFIKITVASHSCTQTLKGSTSYIETEYLHRRHYSLQPSSAPSGGGDAGKHARRHSTTFGTGCYMRTFHGRDPQNGLYRACRQSIACHPCPSTRPA